MGGHGKGKDALTQSGDKKSNPKVGASSSHTVPGAPKRRIDNVANSSAEELVLLITHMDELSGEMKVIRENINGLMKKTDEMMTKADMKAFIKSTVEEIMTEINKNIEMTIDIKVKEKTDAMKNDIKDLNKELETLRNENNKLKKDLNDAQKQNETTDKLAKQGLQKANQNEQYSRKNNIKIRDIAEEPDEDETKLTRTVANILETQGVVIRPEHILAIHRIPAKSGAVKPVLIKFRNNNDKTRVMKARAGMKAAGHRLVDDVTKMNTDLITKLSDHEKIDSAWYFNGAIFGKTTSGKRLKFDIYDDIDSVIDKAEPKK